jgi:D-glycero-D-manno-heptose 1,7-bisphosphate phosphatase
MPMTFPVTRRINRPAEPDNPLRAAVFLDRDGVVIEEKGYLHLPGEVRLIPGAADAIRRFNTAGIPVVLVTNQSGIARGYFGWNEYNAVQERLRAELGDAWLDAEWACGSLEDNRFRKPAPGMFAQAAAALRINLRESWMVGDKPSDIEAARRAGLRGAFLVSTGYGVESRAAVEKLDFPVTFVASLADVSLSPRP